MPLPSPLDLDDAVSYPLVGDYRCPNCGEVIGELRERNGRAWLVRGDCMDEYVQTTCPYCQRLVKFRAYEV
jgi:ssDNA-binding Zn-finger/Zn-ribbon topoisomerase 1